MSKSRQKLKYVYFPFNSSIRSFMATLGPAGGKRGYAGITGHVSNGTPENVNITNY